MSVALAYLLLAMDQSGCVYVKHECTKQPALLPALAPEGGRIRVTAEIDTFGTMAGWAELQWLALMSQKYSGPLGKYRIIIVRRRYI
ncbi:hypothetical protein PABG_11691 [Paracoccidioides brasiliensis Pb03]|nr:hypothetical protein PABG_11691 [Paracoccidioides brasiliensis Pb03]